MSGTDVDVIVAGAGMVGGSLALALASCGLSVAVVEGRPGPRWREDRHDPRVNALHRGSERILRTLGVWDGIARRRVSPFHAIRAWDGHGEIQFDARDHGLTHLGHIVEASAVADELQERLIGHPNVEWIAPAVIDDVQWTSDRVQVSAGGRRRSARLLAGADGARSRIAALCAIGQHWRSYRSTAIVARVAGERPHGETARQRFLASGPLALLPLADGSSSIVWSCRDDLATELLALDAAAFGQRLTEASGAALGTLDLLDHRHSFVLAGRHAQRYGGNRVALLGDAAHLIHPLAGLGANLGLADAAALTAAVGAAHERRRDIGSALVISRYERARRIHNGLVQRTMELFDTVFSGPSATLRRIGGLGLHLVDRSVPAKAFFVRYASGLHRDWSRMPALGVDPAAAP